MSGKLIQDHVEKNRVMMRGYGGFIFDPSLVKKNEKEIMLPKEGKNFLLNSDGEFREWYLNLGDYKLTRSTSFLFKNIKNNLLSIKNSRSKSELQEERFDEVIDKIKDIKVYSNREMSLN